VRFELLSDRAFVETGEFEREVVDVAGFVIDGASAGSSKGRVDSDEVDERYARSELDEPQLLDAPLFCAAEDAAIEGERAVDLCDAQDDVVEAAEFDGRHD
jgi:hypothetical protein